MKDIERGTGEELQISGEWRKKHEERMQTVGVVRIQRVVRGGEGEETSSGGTEESEVRENRKKPPRKGK